MYLRKLSLALAGLALCCPSPALRPSDMSQPRDTVPVRSLRTTVVGARRAAPSVRSAAPLFVLDSAFVARLGLASAADLVRHLPSATVRDYGGPSGLKTVSVRSLGAAHTSVVVDGIPLSDLLSGAVDLSRLPAGRIVTVRLGLGGADDLLSPPSAHTAAFLEVMTDLPGGLRGRVLRNEKPTRRKFRLIQTDSERTQAKSPAAAEDTASVPGKSAPGRLSGAASLEAGQWGTADAAFALGAAAGRGWRVGGQGQWRRSAGDYPFTLRNHSLLSRERRTHGLFQQASALVRAVRRAGTGALTDLRVSAVHDYRQLPGPVVYYTVRGTENVRDGRAEASARHERRSGRWRFSAAGRAAWSDYRYRDRAGHYADGLLERLYRTAELYGLAGVSLGFGRPHDGLRPLTAALAADYTYQHLSASEPEADGAARHSLHAAASLRYAAGRLQLTGRLGAGTVSGPGPHRGVAARSVRSFRPEAAARFVIAGRGADETALRLYWRRSVRPPSFSDCYYYRLGSTDLRAERVRQAGLGMVSEIRAAGGALRLQLTADLYVQRLDDRISALPFSPYLWRMTNRGRACGAGFDLSLVGAARLSPLHALDFAGALSFSDVRDRTAVADRSYGLRPAYVPALWGSASAQWRNPWADVRLWLTAQGERWSTDEHAAGTCLSAAAELGAGLVRRCRLGSAGAEFALECHNLTDTQYEIVRRYPMPGRTWRAVWRVTF